MLNWQFDFRGKLDIYVEFGYQRAGNKAAAGIWRASL